MIHIVLCIAVLGADPAAGPDIRFIEAIPDLTQTDVRGGASGDGNQYCAPVSVSNSFMHLAETGFPCLAPGHDSPALRQIDLARSLASKDYMDTSPRGGTSREGIMRGATKYAEDCGYAIRSIEYRGLKVHFRPDELPESTAPEMDWLRGGISDQGAMWLQVGWYDYDEGEDAYKKLGGHWVTLVGYGVNEAGDVDPRVLVLHDPAPRAGAEFSNEFVRIEEIGSGTLRGYGLPQDAAGLYKLSEGMHLREDADVAILEGAIRFLLTAE